MYRLNARKEVFIMNFKMVLNRGLLFVKKYSPEILTGVGIIAGAIGTVAACKATLHLEPVIDNHKTRIEGIKTQKEHTEMSPKEYREDITKTYAHTIKDIAVLYWPSVVLGGVAIVSVLSAHNILHKRNVALMAAYTVLDNQFKDYRKQVIDKIGEEEEHEIMRRTVEKSDVTVDENGDVKIETSEIKPSIYSAFFDEFNDNWIKCADDNLMFLKCQETYANNILQARGHIFLNEVYEMLGLKHTKYGAVTGWVVGNGDDYVDFGIFDKGNERKRSFVNGYEPSILLNFNVDGVIYNLI